MHWVLDVTFREDDSRTRERTLGNNLSWLRRFAVTLLKRHPIKDSIRGKMISLHDEHRLPHRSPDSTMSLICAGRGCGPTLRMPLVLLARIPSPVPLTFFSTYAER